MFGRTKAVAVPEVGGEAPEFNLPSAQGGQLRLSMRTARGPVVVVFYEGPTEEEEVAYFRDLASREDEINMAGGSVVGIGIAEPDEARDFVEKTGIKSYVLYDYASVATREYGLLEKDKKRGAYTRPATFVVDGDHKVVHSWVGERPKAEDVLAQVSGITGLPKPPEELKAEDGVKTDPAPGKAGKPDEKPEETSEEGEKPKKMSAEERERIKAERRAVREAGKSLKKDGGEAAPGEKPERKRLSPEEREKRRAERRAAREAGEEGAEGGEPEGAATQENGERAETSDGAGARAAAKPAQGDGSEGEGSGEPGGKAAKGE